ncbi:RRM domain-containing protein [Heracleum sosnowskyi]|uniref:RRM domain-containing protein n=1 Tax=Heracleum sosnowskyi TaxID=360622 RepID=A0AAD8MZL4_9APIA|nr:RRM domain-containing protein [Heracleum sosnowskyi]
MGLSRLLHPQITTTTTSLLFRTIGVARQTRRQLSTSAGNRSRMDKARKSEAVETYVKMYVEKNPGSFPKLSHVQKEIGGSWYTLKELLQNAKEKIFGNSKLQSDSINDVTSTSAADATASTVMTTQEKGLEKSDHNEISDTLADTPCHKSNIPPNSSPGTSAEILSDMTADTASDAKRICNDLENTGPHKTRNLIQSSTNMKSEDISVSRAISNVNPEHSSEVPLDATASGVCDSPYAKIPEAASDSNVGTVKVEGILNSPNLIQQKKKHTLKEQHNANDKPEKLSSLIYEATKTWQVKVEDEMASTGRRNQVKNKLFVDLCDKKIEELPAAEPENKHLELEEKSSIELVSSNAGTTATMQNDVPSTFDSIRKELKQKRNQQNVSKVSADKVSKGEVMPASGNGAQKFTRLSDLFSKVDDQKADQVKDKYNILESNGYLEKSDKNSRGNVPKPTDVNDLIDCIKGYPLGQQVTSGPGTAISKKSDQNRHTDHLRVLSQVNMQELDDEGRQTSSSHILSQKSEEPSVEAPVKIAYENGKTDNQEKGNAESVALNANISPMRTRHLDNARDRTCEESLDQYKVIVKFVHKDAGERDLFTVLEQFDNGLKIELSDAGKNRYKTATVYFKTWEGMQKALQTTDLSLRGWTITLEAASSLGQSKNMTIPSLIGDPDAPAALIKNPIRTVAIKQLSHKICPRHIEEALAFCESNISGFFLGSSDSVAYVEFETEDGKDRALAKQSIVVFGKRLFIYRVDTPRTTIVRIKTMLPGILSKHSPIFKAFGKIRASHQRSTTITDVHFCITEWPNMLQILNKINGMQVDGVKLIAEPAPIVPSDVLLELYSQPEERKRIKNNMLRLLQKLEENAVHKTKLTDYFSKFYGEQ